jgi:PleD family two-component response regulator
MNSKVKVLIIDDSATTRKLILKYLGESYDCLEASNGEEGWNALLNDSSISLVFADMHMPVLNGMLLLKRIRESDVERISNIPVIIITGQEDSSVAKRASYNIGATDFLSKPFVRSDIICYAGSYTWQDRENTPIESDVAQGVLNGLCENHMLSEFGNKAIFFAERHKMHVSVMYIQVADIEKLIEKHGIRLMENAADKINAYLNEALRKEEIVTPVEIGKYVVVLQATSAFKANILATRLQQTIRALSFELSGKAVEINLAIGISSTESSDATAKFLTFGEYCIQAQYALNMSLEHKNNRVTRFDETYEKFVQIVSSEQAGASY